MVTMDSLELIQMRARKCVVWQGIHVVQLNLIWIIVLFIIDSHKAFRLERCVFTSCQTFSSA